ncbi:hypothetical protein NHH03_02665 [Stieleria sp. TO1_6]|uniref:glycerophosphodiester phosphodiesterase n=1 Tax=Stieleria tagensis TaxID=2956795 RepID=UPI00209B92AA|nr:glycerophosphodiester phosphodiesterase family protein [Stieleria tagensis]MCO8120626.1 hypothetical protein [Stieleria tagensis]
MKPNLLALCLFTSIVLLCGGQSSDVMATEPVFWQAHRGGGANDAPDNTMRAFTTTWELGGIPEADLRTTTDGVILCLHDATLARTTTAPKSIADRNVKQLTFAEVRNWDAGIKFSPDYSGETVPSLEEVFQKMQGQPDRQVYLDIKDVQLKQLGALIDRYAVNKQVLICSPRQSDCTTLKQISKDIRSMIWIGGSPEDIKTKFQRVVDSKFTGVDQVQLHLHDSDDRQSGRYQISPEFLKQALKVTNDAGIDFQVFPFHFDASDVHQLLDLGIRWYVTDEPKRFQQSVVNWQQKNRG